jgi:hypothetical protein
MPLIDLRQARSEIPLRAVLALLGFEPAGAIWTLCATHPWLNTSISCRRNG